MDSTVSRAERHEAIIEAVRSGASGEAVGAEWGISRARVNAIVRDHWPHHQRLGIDHLRAIGAAAEGQGLQASLHILFADRGSHLILIDPRDPDIPSLNPRWSSALTQMNNRWVAVRDGRFYCLANDGDRIETLTVEI